MCCHFLTAENTNAIALATAIITAAVALITNAWSRRHEKKLAIMKTIMESAFKDYELRTKELYEKGISQETEPYKFLSYTEYLIFYKKMASLFAQKKVSEEDITKALLENKKLIDKYYDVRDAYKPEYHKPEYHKNKEQKKEAK
jgi:hypothetical protein